MIKKNKKERVQELQALVAAHKMAPAEAEALEQQEDADTIDFDGWWAARQTKIPRQHHKEVIKADFRGRGLTTKETMADFDAALVQYGIKLS